MTLSLAQLLVVLLVPALLGAALLRLQGVGPRTDPLAFLGWAWLQGALGVALVLSAWLWLAWPLRGAWISAVLLGLAALGFLLGRRVPLVERTLSEPVHPRWERLLFAAVLAFVLLVGADRVLRASNDAIVHSDEAHIWAAKAKVFFAAGDFGSDFRALMDQPRVVGHKDYPPLNPLLQLWVFAHAGEIVHVENRLPIQAFGLVYVLLVAAAVRRRARPLVAALFVACLGEVAFTRFSLNHAFSDVLVASSLFACWDLWQRWEEEGARVWLRLLGTTAPLLVWSKNEGVLLVLTAAFAFGAAAAARRVRVPGGWLRLCLPLLVSVLYLVWFNRHFGFQNDLLQGEVGSGEGEAAAPGLAQRAAAIELGMVGTILTHFGGLIASHWTHYLPLCFLVLVVVAPRTAFGTGRMTFTLGLLLALVVYMSVYLFTHWELARHLETSAHRLVYHLVPSAGLWILLHVRTTLPDRLQPLEPRARAAAG